MILMEMLLVFGGFFIFAIIFIACFVIVQPVAVPFAMARLKKQDIMIVSGHDGQIKMVPVKYSANLYTSANPPYSFLADKDAKVYTLGGIPAIIVNDSWGIVSDPSMSSAVSALYDLGIYTYDDLIDAIENGDITNDNIVASKAFSYHRVENIANYLGSALTPESLRASIEEQTALLARSYIKKVDELMGIKRDSALGGSTAIVVMLVLAVVLGLGYIVMNGGL
jgi:hypothetical protein